MICKINREEGDLILFAVLEAIKSVKYNFFLLVALCVRTLVDHEMQLSTVGF